MKVVVVGGGELVPPAFAGSVRGASAGTLLGAAVMLTLSAALGV